MKNYLFLLLLPFFTFQLFAQNKSSAHFNAGIVIQKTQNLYFENGVGLDFSHDNFLSNKLHIKASYLSSRLGSAIGTNAIKQDNFILGADYHFLSTNAFQIFAGVNTGLFLADFEYDVFNDLPSSALLLSVEAGVCYNFKALPLTTNLSVGYNLRNGNGVDIPGSLFPVFYKLGLLYSLDGIFIKK